MRWRSVSNYWTNRWRRSNEPCIALVLTTWNRPPTALAQLATAAWLDWLVRRAALYTSLTQQYADWVETLYLNLLPEAEAPSVDRLYNNFQHSLWAGAVHHPHAEQQDDDLLAAAGHRPVANHDGGKAARGRRVIWKTTRPLLRAELIVDKLAYLELRTVCDRLFELAPGELRFRPTIKQKAGSTR